MRCVFFFQIEERGVEKISCYNSAPMRVLPTCVQKIHLLRDVFTGYKITSVNFVLYTYKNMVAKDDKAIVQTLITTKNNTPIV